MSFDVFDTLVTRKTATPRGIFAILQRRLADGSLVPGLPARVRRGFFDMRMFYERAARQRFQDEQIEEVTLGQIYQCLGEAEGLTSGQLQALMELELSVEREHLVGIQENIRQLKSLLASGHRILLISDMYLRAEQIRFLLVEVDGVFQDLPIYSSADMGKGKWNGGSYKLVKEKEGMDIFHWVHTGDNKNADITQARELGIKTIYYNGAMLTRRENELMDKYEGDVRLQLAVGALRLRRLQGEDVSLDALPDLPDEQHIPFGLANRYPVGVLADKIALYGAGRLGRDLYAKLQAYGKGVVCWVDRQAEELKRQGMPVDPVERIQQGGFEQVVIAVKNREKAHEICGALVDMGIGKGDIFWM